MKEGAAHTQRGAREVNAPHSKGVLLRVLEGGVNNLPLVWAGSLRPSHSKKWLRAEASTERWNGLLFL